MIQKSIYTARRVVSEAFSIKLVDKRLPTQLFVLIFQRDAEFLRILISQGIHLRQLQFPVEQITGTAQDFLRSLNPVKAAEEGAVTEQGWQLDERSYFDRVRKSLVSLQINEAQSEQWLSEHMAMVDEFEQMLEPEQLRDYLHNENLTDVAIECEALRLTDEEEIFWSAVWRVIVHKSKALG